MKFRWVYRRGSFILRQLAKLVFRLRIEGRENIPRTGRVIFACNHISVADPPLVGISIPREVHYAAKIGIFRGLWIHFFRWVNAVPVRRKGSDKEAVKRLLHALQAEHAVLIFPEGTNSPSGKPLPAKPGIGLLAYQTESWILPVHIDGTQHAQRGWWHLVRFILRLEGEGVSLRFGEPYQPSVLQQPDLSPREAYRHIAQEAMEHILAVGGMVNDATPHKKEAS